MSTFLTNLKQAIRNVASPRELLEQNKHVVDELVEEKLSRARQEADRFVGNKVEELKNEAWVMVDMLEKRIDAKLLEFERRLDERLQKEIYWKLVGLRYTLLFVLGSAAIGIGYALIRRYLIGA